MCFAQPDMVCIFKNEATFVNRFHYSAECPPQKDLNGALQDPSEAPEAFRKCTCLETNPAFFAECF